jgi:HSP20 family protein
MERRTAKRKGGTRMALIKWESRGKELSPFRSLREEVDRVFDDFFRGWPSPWRAGWPTAEQEFVPTVSLKETEKEFVLTAEVPGISKEGLDVAITEDSVTIKGERKEEKETREESYHYKESTYGTFERVIPLPSAILADKAKAKLKDGVLSLTLPKSEVSKIKEIKVKVE